MTVSIVEPDSESAVSAAPVAASVAPAQHVRSERIVALQLLRAVAATAVVFDHFQIILTQATGGASGLPDLSRGVASVDLFFVISGFVIVYASEPLFAKAGGPAAFITYRLVRIVPLYWLITTLYLAIGLALPSIGKVYFPGYTAASYLFFPIARPDGEVAPLVSQGWTLNYEILFYVIFSAAVLFSRRTAVAAAAIVLGGLTLAGATLAPTQQPFAFWTNSIMIEFVFGMILAVAYREGLRMPAWLALGTIVLGVVLFVIGTPAGEARFLQYGVPAALMVMGATLGGFSLRSQPWPATALVGDASYSLYLSHLLPIVAVLFLARHAGIALAAASWGLLAAGVLAAIAVAIVLHLAFERPVTRALRRLTAAARPNSPLDNRLVRS